MPTFNPSQRTVEVPVPASDLPKVVEKPTQQQPQQPQQIKSTRTIVLPFVHSQETTETQ